MRRWHELTATEKEAWRRWVFETSIQFGASYEAAGKVADLFCAGLDAEATREANP